MSRSRVCLALLAVPALAAPAAADAPTPEELAALVRQEPFTPQSWPAWSARLHDWSREPPGRTAAAFRPAYAFLKGRLDRGGNLPRPFDRDAVAWMVLGAGQLDDAATDPAPVPRYRDAEKSLRRAVGLDHGLARAHFLLGEALRRKEFVPAAKGGPARPDVGRLRDARKAYQEARALDPAQPALPPREAGLLALWTEDYAEAEAAFRQATQEAPDDVEAARLLARAVTAAPRHDGPRAAALRPLAERFAGDGPLLSRYGLALAQDGDLEGASRQFAAARRAGTDPATVVNPADVRNVEEATRPSPAGTFLRWMLGFFLAYGLVIAAMAAAGVVLARYTHGPRALELLDAPPGQLVARGQVLRTLHESRLTRAYCVVLTLALVLFYLAIPFVIWGLLVLTLVLGVLGMFLNRDGGGTGVHGDLLRASGGGLAAVFRALFAGFGKGSFGVLKTADDCPRLYGALEEVARRVDTDPVDEVYVAPGAGIGVHQEGRGPFGLLGTRRRVLTLGLSTLHFLTADELKAILAHEYAHFSHADTFWVRFIHQVTLSIGRAVDGMRRSGGWVCTVNPFYWFFFLYRKAYGMLSSGFSRSREFLADRMACTLYGSDVFAGALTKVCTDGTLFEMTVYKNIAGLLRQKKAYVNMYKAFREYRDGQLSQNERDRLYKKLLQDEESVFASHPTFGERLRAIEGLPKAAKPDATPALNLFEDAERLERELTDFLTEAVDASRW
jgi:Zn-dependent protease with chaperone function/Flp pilus assembly protein TadD